MHLQGGVIPGLTVDVSPVGGSSFRRSGRQARVLYQISIALFVNNTKSHQFIATNPSSSCFVDGRPKVIFSGD